MLRDRPKSFEHGQVDGQVHIFVFQPVDRQLTSQEDLSNVWGQSRTPRQIAKSYQGESHCKIPVVFLIISKARNLVQITASPPEIRFYSEDRNTLGAEATSSLCELSCEK